MNLMIISDFFGSGSTVNIIASTQIGFSHRYINLIKTRNPRIHNHRGKHWQLLVLDSTL